MAISVLPETRQTTSDINLSEKSGAMVVTFENCYRSQNLREYGLHLSIYTFIPGKLQIEWCQLPKLHPVVLMSHHKNI